MLSTPVIEARQIGWVLGQFLLALAATLAIPLLYALVSEDAGRWPFIGALAITLASALPLLLLCRQRERRELKPREAILLVVLVWGAACLFGALPFWFSPLFQGFTDALFEATSGFTTTGATVLNQLESVPPSLNLWRCFSHWLGGMGVVLLGLAILPIIGQGGMHLYQAEFSGADSQRLQPRLAEVIKAFWWIYLLYTVLLFSALLLAGMSPFEAVCHAFSTLGTGGFSTRDQSIGAFASPLIEYIIIVFMLLAGISFIQHYRLLVERQPRRVVRDSEWLGYLLLVLGFSLIVTLLLMHQGERAWEPALRAALFQVASIISTTGFVTDDYGLWPPLGQLLLLLLMFVGGSTGSTAGGIKVARLVLLTKVVRRELHRVSEPHGVFSLRLNGEAVPEQTVSGLLNLLYLAWMLLIIASIAVAATGVDLLTTLTAVIACTFNIGPGLAGVGPTQNFAALPDLAKWVLSGCMLAGRLEFYTLLVILTHSFWRR